MAVPQTGFCWKRSTSFVTIALTVVQASYSRLTFGCSAIVCPSVMKQLCGIGVEAAIDVED
jgi:hypothetical protein